MRMTITVDGVPTEEDVDLDAGNLTMQQSVLLENIIGEDKCYRLLNGDKRVAASPSTIRAIVFARVSGRFPEMSIDDFEFDLADLFADQAGESDAVVVPMTLPDGSQVEGASSHVDPPETPTVAV